jgi:protein-S-isoprenylcysteine O-methyltransferase Ste14
VFEFSVIALILFWALWLYPFAHHRFSGPKRKSNVTAPGGKWGLVLQTIGIFFAWFRMPNTPGASAARISAALLLAAISTVIGWLAVRHLGKQLRILAGLYPDHELIRTGPYALVRHPVYAALFLLMLATGLILSKWPFLLLAVTLYIAGTEIRIRAEEDLLRARFKEEFEDYRRRVPAYIPFVR